MQNRHRTVSFYLVSLNPASGLSVELVYVPVTG
jgi:hypothetical protein